MNMKPERIGVRNMHLVPAFLLILLCACAEHSGGGGHESRPSGKLTLDGTEYDIADISFYGEDLEFGGRVLSYREMYLSSPDLEDGPEPAIELFARFESRLLANDVIPLTELQGQPLLIRPLDVEGDAVSSLAISGTEKRQLVVGGTLTLTEVGTEREASHRGDGYTEIVRSWDVKGTVALEVATNTSLLEQGFNPKTLADEPTNSLTGSFTGVATCRYLTD